MFLGLFQKQKRIFQRIIGMFCFSLRQSFAAENFKAENFIKLLEGVTDTDLKGFSTET